MKLYCLRHGRTDYNELGLCNGDPAKPVHLTDEGKRQAEKAAQQLSTVELERLFVSELPRTQQTARIINRHHQIPIEIHSALNDILSGCEDQPVTDYQAAIAHDPVGAKVDGGESLIEYQKRVKGFLEWLKRQPYSKVGLVAHEETMRIIHGYFNDLDIHELPKLHFANCEIHQFNHQNLL
jgi:broad specificity phosphatase PhoE